MNSPADSGRSWPGVIGALLARRDLELDDTHWVMDQVLSGVATPVQLAGFLVALRAKGETAAEMRGLADGMLAHATPISVDGVTIDVVGTGGDQAHTVNISTMAAIVVAGAGRTVVKHGNRAASSASGSADVLEALGVRLDLSAPSVQQVAEQAGITFCFAQTFHPSFRYTATARRELGLPTAFNFLGPLTNPARPTHSAVGVADARMAPFLAQVFAERGKSAAVFRGDDGLDELTLATTSRLWWVADGGVAEHQIDPTRYGLANAPTEALRGGDAQHNAGVVRDLLAGATGPVRDAVLLNAGIALALPLSEETGERRADDLMKAGIETAASAIDDGRAAAKLQAWISTSAELVGD